MTYIVLFGVVSTPGGAKFKGEILSESDIAPGEVENLLTMGAIQASEDEVVIPSSLKLADMTKKDLILYGQERGIEIDPNLKKPEILEILLEAAQPREETSEPEGEDPTE